MSDLITLRDVRTAVGCTKGIRRWCRENGVDFRRLAKQGIPVAEVEDWQDGHVQRAVKIAKERVDGR